MNMRLDEIFKYNNCDRWEHGYNIPYEADWCLKREEPIKILELGVWNGNGINSWTSYFPNAEVVGIDVFTRLRIDEVRLKKPDQVTLIEGSSQDPKTYEQLGDMKFDMIVDDAQHTPKANRLTFEAASPYLKDDGFFYIEDVWPLNIMTPAQKNIPWLRAKPDEYNEKEYQKFLDSMDGYTATMYDLRETHKADSCIFKVFK